MAYIERAGSINELKAKMYFPLETEVMQWGMLAELQSVTGRRPNITQMTAGCLSLCLASRLSGKWENGENLSEASACGPRVSRSMILRKVRTMLQALTEC